MLAAFLKWPMQCIAGSSGLAKGFEHASPCSERRGPTAALLLWLQQALRSGTIACSMQKSQERGMSGDFHHCALMDGMYTVHRLALIGLAEDTSHAAEAGPNQRMHLAASAASSSFKPTSGYLPSGLDRMDRMDRRDGNNAIFVGPSHDSQDACKAGARLRRMHMIPLIFFPRSSALKAVASSHMAIWLLK